MRRNLKILGLTVVAALAMSVVASAAQAAEFTASEYPAEFHGTNTAGSEVFTTEAGSVECASTFSGSAGEKSTTVTAHPEYSGCKAFGFLSATVTTTGCDYVFHLGEGGPPYSGTADVDCEEGKVITITASNCTATVGSQTDLESVDFANSGEGIAVTATVSEIDYTVTKDGLFCPFSGTGARSDGEYTSNSAVTITDPGNELDIG